MVLKMLLFINLKILSENISKILSRYIVDYDK